MQPVTQTRTQRPSARPLISVDDKDTVAIGAGSNALRSLDLVQRSLRECHTAERWRASLQLFHAKPTELLASDGIGFVQGIGKLTGELFTAALKLGDIVL